MTPAQRPHAAVAGTRTLPDLLRLLHVGLPPVAGQVRSIIPWFTANQPDPSCGRVCWPTATPSNLTPLVADFNARASNGGPQYRLINTAPVPNGLGPTPIAQGSQESGKLYFDLTGPPPTEVVCNDGVQDVLIWS